MAAGDRLDGARARIDALDAEIQERIVERARVAQEVRDIKRAEGDLSDHYRPAREAQVLKVATERNKALSSPLSDAAMASIMREIMSACLALETPLSVSYLGPEGTYTQSAVYKHFGHQVSTRVAAAIDDIFRDVESGAASYGVVPVENSTEGVVTSTLDLLLATPLSICGEVLLPVHHHLLSGFDAIERIDVVYAHPQSFAQCRRWLDNQLPNTPREPMPSNGAAARRVSETGRGAAIASAAAGVLYKLNALAANIEDDPNNTTRFLVIGRQQPEPTGADRTSLVCSAPQGGEPGALFSLLEPFAKAGVNLSKIESRPSRRAAWDYNFYLDLDGHQADPTVAQVIDDVRSRAAFFKILGSYPRATDQAG